MNNGEGEVDMRGGRLPAPKARNPARYLTTPFSQLPVGHMMDGVPRALQGPLMRPAAATCFGHRRSNTIASEAPAIRSAVCSAARFRLISAEIMGGAPAHLECQCYTMASTPYNDGRPRAPPAPACCIGLHDTPNRRHRQFSCCSAFLTLFASRSVRHYTPYLCFATRYSSNLSGNLGRSFSTI